MSYVAYSTVYGSCAESSVAYSLIILKILYLVIFKAPLMKVKVLHLNAAAVSGEYNQITFKKF